MVRARRRRTAVLLSGSTALLLAGCSGAATSVDTSILVCTRPWLDSQPPASASVAAARPVRAGDSVTIYGHGFTRACTDEKGNGGPSPVAVRLTVTWPGGTVTHLGPVTPTGSDAGFAVRVQVPGRTPAGVAKVRDDEAQPARYRFRVGR